MKKLFRILTSLIVVSTFLFACDKVETKHIENVVVETMLAETTTIGNIEVQNELASMEIVDITTKRGDNSSLCIEIEFTKKIADKFDADPYIKIEPSVFFSVSKVDKKLLIKGEFDRDKEYTLTVSKGIKAVDSTSTKVDKVETVKFTKKPPKLMWTSEGIILPSVNEKKIYVRSMNVDKVNVYVDKIYVNNTTQFLQTFNFTRNGSYYGNVKNVGDRLYDVRYDIENVADEWTQTAIDLSQVVDSKGIYIVSVKNADDKSAYDSYENDEEYAYYSYYDGSIRKTILQTDIGIIAAKTNESIHVNVLDIVQNKSLNNIKTYLVSKNNQILEEKTTSVDGVVDFALNKNAFYILAESDSDRSILMLNNSLNMDGFSVDGETYTDGINGFIYTERGVYRPGDNVYVSIIARNNNEVLEDNQPVNITVHDPTGAKVIENDVVKGGKNGFYTYSFKTDTSARTGIWKLKAIIGNKILTKDISIETVVPNKIKVKLDIPNVVNYDEDIVDWTINANYLFGAPAGELKYEVDYTIKEEPIDFEKFKGYNFKAPTTYDYYKYSSEKGTLSENGVADIAPKISNLDFPSVNLLMDVKGEVADDGGRKVKSSKFVKIKKYDTYIGIENTETYKKPGEKLDLKVICVTEDGENLVAGKKLKYRIYGNNNYWWWDYSDYTDFIYSFKSDKNTTIKTVGYIETLDTPTLIDYVLPEDTEYIYVEIEDESTGQITAVNLQSSYWIDPSITKKIETLNIMTDKKKYDVGDVVKVSFKGAKSSLAIITIEKAGKIINQYYKNVNDGDITEEINITKEMTPNIYVYVMLIQDYLTKENDRPLRLYGVVPINVEDADTKIDLEIEAPESIMPNEKFSVKIKNKNNKKFDFTIAVVDEGLLDITSFVTPTPWDYFYKKIATALSIFDNYSQITDRPYGKVNQILKVGGDGALLDEMARRRRLKELGLEDAERFTPVSMFKGVLSSDENGYAIVDFDMPNYMGSVRIMVIAVDGNSYGSYEKNMIVKAPIIMIPTFPRTMKVGDKLRIPVSLFALETDVSNVEVYYKFRENTQTKNLDLKKGDKQIIYFDEEVGNEVGNEKMSVGIKSSVYNYEETVGMAVNSDNTPIEIVKNDTIDGNGQWTYTNEESFVIGTVDSAITISNKMKLGLDQRLEYLIRYPYGCVEQTVSSVFPQLFIDKLATVKQYDKNQIVKNINAGIERLKYFQLPNGSFSYWQGGKETSEWNTNYVMQFLIYARKNGYYVPDSMYNNCLEYISNSVKSNSDIDDNNSLKCYSLYLLALANKANVSEMNYIMELRSNFVYETSKMYLGASYKLIGEEETAKKLIKGISPTSIKKQLEEILKDDRYYYDYSYGSKLRQIAVYLDCYYTIMGEMDKSAFDEILNALRTSDWYSTQTTAYTLLALSNITNDNSSETLKGVIEIDGLHSKYETTSEYRLEIPENAKNIKVIAENTDGKTYVNYYLEGVPINSDMSDYSEGFTIERNYYDNGGKIMNISSVNSGDTIWMEVIVKPTNENTRILENIALTQILPTGFEIENLRLTNQKSPNWVEQKETEVDYTDIRDDRIMWFFNYYGNNGSAYHFFVKINAVTSGKFTFPGTVLEAMYDNNYRAYKKGETIEIK